MSTHADVRERVREVRRSWLGSIIAGGIALLASLCADDARAAWHDPVDARDAINGSASAQRPSLTRIGGVPYVASSDASAGGIVVKRLKADGTEWEQVGDVIPGVTPSLADAGGVPYVAWVESPGLIRVSRLNGAGTAFELVGGATPLNASAAQSAQAPSLAVVGGVAHVAWSESDGANSEIRVSRLNGAGTAWTQVVGGASPINRSPSHDAFEPSLIAVGSVPYVAWPEYDGAVIQIHESHLNGAGDDWVPLIDEPSPINASATEDADDPSLAQIDGVVYVAWSEYDGDSWQIRVARCDPDADVRWEQLDPTPINRRTDDINIALEPSLAAINGLPYVAWVEHDGIVGYQARVSRLDAEGTCVDRGRRRRAAAQPPGRDGLFAEPDRRRRRAAMSRGTRTTAA